MKISRVSVAICTWNRAGLLVRLLSSLTAQDPIDLDSWEVLVVNNNCTDDTESVIASFSDRLPIRSLWEPVPGLSNARNRAITEATGQYIIWTDDDVAVEKAWLSTYISTFRSCPSHAVFGGPIRPEFEGTPPHWLISVWADVETAYAMRDLGTEATELHPDGFNVPLGANYAIRADLQRRHRYDPQLGRTPDRPFQGGEETNVIGAILAEGWHGLWVPGAAVRHWVPKSRQSATYIRRYWAGYGAYTAVSQVFHEYPAIFGVPRWLLRCRIEHEFKYFIGRLLRRPNRWIAALKWAGYSAGQIATIRARKVTKPAVTLGSTAA